MTEAFGRYPSPTKQWTNNAKFSEDLAALKIHQNVTKLRLYDCYNTIIEIELELIEANMTTPGDNQGLLGIDEIVSRIVERMKQVPAFAEEAAKHSEGPEKFFAEAVTMKRLVMSSLEQKIGATICLKPEQVEKLAEVMMAPYHHSVSDSPELTRRSGIACIEYIRDHVEGISPDGKQWLETAIQSSREKLDQSAPKAPVHPKPETGAEPRPGKIKESFAKIKEVQLGQVFKFQNGKLAGGLMYGAAVPLIYTGNQLVRGEPDANGKRHVSWTKTVLGTGATAAMIVGSLIAASKHKAPTP